MLLKLHNIIEERDKAADYLNLRSADVQQVKHPYPHKFYVSQRLSEIEQGTEVSAGEVLENKTVSIAGRVHYIRKSGKALVLDLRADGMKIQVGFVVFSLCRFSS